MKLLKKPYCNLSRLSLLISEILQSIHLIVMKMSIVRSAMIVVVAFIMPLESFAQEFSLKAGINLSKMFMHDHGITYSNEYAMKPGFDAGIIYNFKFSNALSSETGIILSTKGYKNTVMLDLSGAKESSSQKLNLIYIIIPYTAKVYFGKGSTRIFGLLGPYLGMGISGTSRIEQNMDGNLSSYHTKIKWGTKNGDDLRRLDFGITMGAGIKIKSVELGLSYDYGLSNITSATLNLSGSDIGNRVFGFSVSVPFFRLKKASE